MIKINSKSKINSILIKKKLIKNIINKKNLNPKINNNNKQVFQINLIFNNHNKFKI